MLGVICLPNDFVAVSNNIHSNSKVLIKYILICQLNFARNEESKMIESVPDFGFLLLLRYYLLKTF